MRILEKDFPVQSHYSLQSFHPAKISDMEKNPSIKAARVTWENGINEELQIISAERQRSFSIPQSVPPLLSSLLSPLSDSDTD